MTIERPQHLDDDAAVALLESVERIVIDFIGMKPPLSGVFAAKLVEGFRSEHGGNRVYIPSSRTKIDREKEREERNRRIVEMYNGRNIRMVMTALGVSRRTVYKAISESRKK